MTEALTVGNTVDTLDIGPYSLELQFNGRDRPEGDRRSMAVNHYTLHIDGPNGHATFPFWDSVNATEQGETADASRAFSSLVLDVLHIVAEYEGPYDPGLDNDGFIEQFGAFMTYQGYADGDASRALRTWMQMNNHASDLLHGVGMSEDHLYALGNAPAEEIEDVDLEGDQ